MDTEKKGLRKSGGPRGIETKEDVGARPARDTWNWGELLGACSEKKEVENLAYAVHGLGHWSAHATVGFWGNGAKRR
jgi:hypothetical protein